MKYLFGLRINSNYKLSSFHDPLKILFVMLQFKSKWLKEKMTHIQIILSNLFENIEYFIDYFRKE
jgi:hypothetical protein